MKKHFLTGLVVLLPAVITYIILGFVIHILTNPFLSGISGIFNYFDIFNKPFLLMSGPQVLEVVSRIFILCAIIFIVFLTGVLGRMFLLDYLSQLGEYIIHRIPIISTIYKSIHEIVNTLFAKPKEVEGEAYSRVVLVPYPHSETLSIGLITKGNLPEDSDPDHRKLVSVFVPGTPNPSMGFMLMFPRELLIPLDLTVEQALKFVVSIGVIYPETATKNLQK